MEVVDIFAVSESAKLHAVQWDFAEVNEFERVLDFMTDPMELYYFFKAHEGDLRSGFYGSISIESAVERTRAEALELKRELLVLCEQGYSKKYSGFKELFQPLKPLEYSPSGFERNKAYGQLSKSMIRIYALKLPDDLFLITGGTIKITAKMQDREHTKLELLKFEQTKLYLKDNGISL
jgi:hypothetical protein